MKLIQAIISYYNDIKEGNITKEEFEDAVEQHFLEFFGANMDSEEF